MITYLCSMTDYSKGKIYKIIDESNNDVYYGSTTQTLKRRYKNHEVFTRYNKSRDNCRIELIEDYPCNSREELEKREQYYLDNNDCINKKRAFTSRDLELQMNRTRVKKWIEQNRDYYLEEHKKRNNKRREYQKSWGGRTDHDNNSLLKIDVNLFT